MRVGFIGFIILGAVSSVSAMAADANHGKELFLACAACHTEKADALVAGYTPWQEPWLAGS